MYGNPVPSFFAVCQRSLHAANAEKRFASLTCRAAVFSLFVRLVNRNTSWSSTMAFGPPQAGLRHLFPNEMLAFPKRPSACRHRLTTKADSRPATVRANLKEQNPQVAQTFMPPVFALDTVATSRGPLAGKGHPAYAEHARALESVAKTLGFVLTATPTAGQSARTSSTRASGQE
jgi:hypothetical protein